MKKTRIYLAGAMGCYKECPEKASKWRSLIKENLKNTSAVCIDPMTFYNYNSNYHKTEKEIMRYELNLIRKCDLVIVNLHDIEKSIGTIDEVMFAYLNHIPVVGFKCTSLPIGHTLHPWLIEQLERIETCGDEKTAIEDLLDYVMNYYVEVDI